MLSAFERMMRESRKRFQQISDITSTDTPEQRTDKIIAWMEADKGAYTSLLDEYGKVKPGIKELILKREKVMGNAVELENASKEVDSNDIALISSARIMLTMDEKQNHSKPDVKKKRGVAKL